MDVTPTKRMFEAMEKFVEQTVGEAPLAVEKSAAAEERRAMRRLAMDFLHNFARLSMRVGVGRYLQDRGQPTVEDEIRPNPVKAPKLNSDIIASAND